MQQEFFENRNGILSVAAQVRADATDVDRMIAFLKFNQWSTAQEVSLALGYGNTEGGKRKVRAIAAESAGRIISGQAGYCSTANATPEERKHAAAWLRSQAREMMERADRIEAIVDNTQRLLEPDRLRAGDKQDALVRKSGGAL